MSRQIRDFAKCESKHTAFHKRKSSVEDEDSDKKCRDEGGCNYECEEHEHKHRHSEERNSKHKHKHKHHRHDYESRSKYKHECRMKSRKNHKDSHGNGRSFGRETTTDENRENKEGRDGKAAKTVSIEKFNKEEGEISGGLIASYLRAATESEIESGEIKSDGECAEVKLASRKFLGGNKEESEVESAYPDNPSLAPTEDTELNGLSKDASDGHTSPIQRMHGSNVFGFKEHAFDDYWRDDMLIVKDSLLFEEFSKESSVVKPEPLELEHIEEETGEDITTRCQIENSDTSCKVRELSENEFGKESKQIDEFVSCVQDLVLMEVPSPEKLQLFSQKRDGLTNIKGFKPKDENVLSPVGEIDKDRKTDPEKSRLSPEQGRSKRSKHQVHSESTKYLHGKSSHQRSLKVSKRYSSPPRSTQSRLHKDSEDAQKRARYSNSRDSFAKSDRKESSKNLKDINDDRRNVSHTHVYSLDKMNRRSRSRDSFYDHRRENCVHGRHDNGHDSGLDKSQRSPSREILDGRSEIRGRSRCVRARDKHHERSHRESQSTLDRYSKEEHRNRQSEANCPLNRSFQNSRQTMGHVPEKMPREEENQEEYVERVALQLAAQEEDDLEKIKEESRRRRQAILEKYKTQKSLPQDSVEAAADILREVPNANEHTGEPQVGDSSLPFEAGKEKQNEASGFSCGDICNANCTRGATLVLERGSSQKDSVLQGKVGGPIGLGEGSPKSERSDMFCDDIFGDSPAGGRRAGKGDSFIIDTSSLIDNWDDAEGYYCYRIGEVLDNRYEVASSHGRGVFSHVVRARDLKSGRGDPEEVAIKIIRNNETMFKAGQTELNILKKVAGADPENRRHCVRLISSFEYRSHLCLVFESLHMNLREVLKKFGRNIGINLLAVRAYAKQLFIALKHLRNCGVLHCDIKPDNILVNEAKNVLKLCDFGSAMFAGENEITPYLVSRFYRAPEIILGLPYDHALDVWSVGCCLYEFYTGKVLFPGPTNSDMLKLQMELKGTFPKKMLKKAAFKDQHFDQDYNFCAVEEDPVTKKMVKRILANVKPSDIGRLIGGSCKVDEDSKMVVNFKDLLDKLFVLDPDKRLTVSQALNHPFITGK